ncbi:pilus assembly protein TadG-related protein [Streptomyces hydrogenans]|uniref:pilus assembly protein TadG-related protein n=1 Tax=Streptomyces hydrogenans TaxID=1873719 RepID=UPI0038165AF4
MGVSADRSESGQAFPAYVAVIAGLLFLAFVYFAVGRAAVLRSGAQTAADAAALGAAQDARDQLREGWLEVIDDPAQWQLFVRGAFDVDSGLACERAADLAASNDATVEDCTAASLRFDVMVQTNGAVGDSIVPDTETRKATATATAVIEPRCSFVEPEPTEQPGPTEEPEPTEVPTSTPSADPEPEPELILGLTCDGEVITIDPENPLLPGAGALFRVRLTGDHE